MSRLWVPSGKCQRGEIGFYVWNVCYATWRFVTKFDFVQTKVRVNGSKGLLKEGLFWKMIKL